MRSASFAALCALLIAAAPAAVAGGAVAAGDAQKVVKLEDMNMVEHLHEPTDLHNSFAVAGFFVGQQSHVKDALAEFRKMGEQAFTAWPELKGWSEQLDKVTFGFSQDRELAAKYNCVGEHEMDEKTPGQGTHKEWDFCILTWKAFHNNVMGGFGVNEDRRMFDAGSKSAEDRAGVRRHIVAKLKEKYVPPVVKTEL